MQLVVMLAQVIEVGASMAAVWSKKYVVDM